MGVVLASLQLCLAVVTAGMPGTATCVPPPLPVLPIPSAAQLAWQRREIIIFFHFGMNTFTDSELGTGGEDPSLFAPAVLNASQWMDAAAAAGASLAILVAKHHDGFCLWPSAYTAHSVRASPWRDGAGDVVREFTAAAHARGVDAGLYLSPWDRHDERYGREVAYNEYYLAQLHELLAGYGSMSEIWFDGHKEENATNMTYHFDEWFQTVRQLQSSIVMFSDAGPDVRWVGNEDGFVGTTCWSTINRSMITIGQTGLEGYLNKGDPRGTDWVPPECDVTIRPGWFWHRNETAKPLSQLLEIYYTSVGRNCVLLLNVPPNAFSQKKKKKTCRLTPPAWWRMPTSPGSASSARPSRASSARTSPRVARRRPTASAAAASRRATCSTALTRRTGRRRPTTGAGTGTGSSCGCRRRTRRPACRCGRSTWSEYRSTWRWGSAWSATRCT